MIMIKQSMIDYVMPIVRNLFNLIRNVHYFVVSYFFAAAMGND